LPRLLHHGLKRDELSQALAPILIALILLRRKVAAFARAPFDA
jgi:hypothetical protein